MVLKQLFIISLIVLLSGGLSDSFSEDAKQRVKGPIVVTSETLTADNKANTALFERNVVATTPEMTIHADKMLVFYKEQGGEVTKIEATGNVRLHKDTSVITSQSAVYYADQDKLVFTGSPRAVDGENVVTGSKMTFLIKEDRSIVENSKVFLKNKKEQ